MSNTQLLIVCLLVAQAIQLSATVAFYLECRRSQRAIRDFLELPEAAASSPTMGHWKPDGLRTPINPYEAGITMTVNSGWTNRDEARAAAGLAPTNQSLPFGGPPNYTFLPMHTRPHP